MKDKINKIYNTDNIEYLKSLPDCSISSIITDVPYALCDIDPLAMIKENTNNTRGFMGKTWDKLPTIEFLKECNRVLKDGAFFITTFSPREGLKSVFITRALEAGFDVDFTPILWAFASGFPKSADYSKLADKRAGAEREVVGEKLTTSTLTKRQIDGKRNNNIGFDSGGGSYIMQITTPTTPEAKYLNGLKSCQLKPAYETILIFQKPHKQKSKIDQALLWYNERKAILDKGITEEDLALYTKNASGGIRIDANDMFEGAMSSRIPIENIESEPGYRPNIANHKTSEGKTSIMNVGGNNFALPDCGTYSSNGRFPATILCEGNILTLPTNDLSRYFTVDAWTKKNLPELYKVSKKAVELQEDAEKISPFLFTAKPDKATKNAGLEGFEMKQVYDRNSKSDSFEGMRGEGGKKTLSTQNTHPTGKPIQLYAYLCNLFTHPYDIVLDPFCGSGTTPIACLLTNRHYIGLELEKEYFDIAEARVKFWQEQKEAQSNKTSKDEGTLL